MLRFAMGICSVMTLPTSWSIWTSRPSLPLRPPGPPRPRTNCHGLQGGAGVHRLRIGSAHRKKGPGAIPAIPSIPTMSQTSDVVHQVQDRWRQLSKALTSDQPTCHLNSHNISITDKPTVTSVKVKNYPKWAGRPRDVKELGKRQCLTPSLVSLS